MNTSVWVEETGVRSSTALKVDSAIVAELVEDAMKGTIVTLVYILQF